MYAVYDKENPVVHLCNGALFCMKFGLLLVLFNTFAEELYKSLNRKIVASRVAQNLSLLALQYIVWLSIYTKASECVVCIYLA